MIGIPELSSFSEDVRVGTVVQVELHAGSFETEAAPLLIDLGVDPLLVIGKMPDPEPGPGEVRIRVVASGINPGDVKKRQDAFSVGSARDPA